MNAWVDGWVGGWVDGWRNDRTKLWIDGLMHKCIVKVGLMM